MLFNLLPNSLLNTLAFLPPNTAVAGLLRHAERHVIPPGDFGNNVALTEKGRLSCQLLRSHIKSKLKCLYTSPVKRCMQTAKLIGEDKKTKSIVASTLLGDPGIFIDDVHQAHHFCKVHEPLPIVTHLLSDQPNPAGFCKSTSEASYALLKYLLNATSESGLSLFITHDSILSVVLGLLFEETSIDNLWPTYLEGLFIWQQDDYLHIIYRDNYKKLIWTD